VFGRGPWLGAGLERVCIGHVRSALAKRLRKVWCGTATNP